jgi:hypothetical protein
MAAAVVGMAAAGCGGSDGPEMAKVTGTVTYNGKPVPKGTISFQPTDPVNGAPANGIIDSDGSYRLQTTEPGDGARLGDYQVAIRSVEGEPDVPLDYTPKKRPPAPKSLIPKKYENPMTSGLTAKVESGSNSIDFDLKD